MGRDWDEIFAYETVKLARVHDRRLVRLPQPFPPVAASDADLPRPACSLLRLRALLLLPLGQGMLHYGFLGGIFVYIVVVVLLIDKEYLLREVPEGTVRVGLLPPNPVPDGATCSESPCKGYQNPATALGDYCGTGGPTPTPLPGAPLLMNFAYECRYHDDKFAVWPGIEQVRSSCILCAHRPQRTSICGDLWLTTAAMPCGWRRRRAVVGSAVSSLRPGSRPKIRPGPPTAYRRGGHRCQGRSATIGSVAPTVRKCRAPATTSM
jgi:hypothetical protein